jgi:hypothetical protein
MKPEAVHSPDTHGKVTLVVRPLLTAVAQELRRCERMEHSLFTLFEATF